MFLVHRVAGERVVESAGAAKHLLLGSGTMEEAATRVNPIGKIQRQRPYAVIDQSQ
tara:strand:- start:1009 stop:1176 length:168 start_codon:yes stop_codon:yes gene_type:complete